MLESHACDSARAARDEQAFALFMRMDAAQEDSPEWMTARTELYEMHEELSYSFASKYFGNKRLSPEDIRQCCRIAVVRAIDDWNPERGSLTTVIAYWVFREIRWWLRQEQMYRSSSPSDHEDSTQERCQPKHRRKCDLHVISTEQITLHLSDDADYTDFVVEQSIPGHEDPVTFGICVENALMVLDPEKRQIVEQYYGLHGEEQHTLRELEPVFQMSYQTVKNRLTAAHQLMAPLLEGFA